MGGWRSGRREERSMSEDDQDNSAPQKMSLLTHLEALRKVIMVCVIAILVTSVVAFAYVDVFLAVVVKPATDLHIKLIYTGVTEGIFFKLHIALVFGAMAASPILLWQFWRFLVPALYPTERRYITRLVPISILLFLGGVVFAYFTVLHFMLIFLKNVSSEFTAMITISNYLSFTEHLLIPFGLLFEYPLLIYFLSKIGVITPELLVRYRKYSIVGVFIIAAILTPSPDPLTMLIVACPMLILYETGIIVARIVFRKKRLQIKLADERG
jgi:sec-independent protein translocase protein TatC